MFIHLTSIPVIFRNKFHVNESVDGQWTIVLPLLVIMELDGLTSSHTPLEVAAASAYIVAYLHAHSASLGKDTGVARDVPPKLERAHRAGEH